MNPTVAPCSETTPPNPYESNAAWTYAMELPPLDLQQLQRRCMGRIELVDRLLASFEKRFPVELLEIEESLTAQDEPRLLMLVHRLKGAAANISAPVLHRVIQQMESAIHAGQWAAAEQCLATLQSEWERFTHYKGSVCAS